MALVAREGVVARLVPELVVRLERRELGPLSQSRLDELSPLVFAAAGRGP